VRGLKRTICNIEDGRQLVKASGSVGADHIEANEALSKKDFRMRVRISRQEAQESRYWLRLIDTNGDDRQDKERHCLIGEAAELVKILSSILHKSQ
jgi:four helix bundle protein